MLKSVSRFTFSWYLLFSILFLPPLFSQDKSLDRFEKRTFRGSQGDKLLYRVLPPRELEKGKKYPLVLFLHGAGERGSDNRKQLVHGMKDFASAEVAAKYPAFVIAPQCPSGKQWVEVPWSAKSHKLPAEPSVPLRLSLELVDQSIASLPIDPSRVYVTGLSMGGYGTFDAICRRPGLFAAALPICGGGDENLAPKIRSVPIWIVHGDADRVVVPSRSENMFEALKKAGGTPRLTLLKGVGHNSWSSTYSNPATYQWLFSQKRKGKATDR